ncbi:cytochrome c [Roseobacter sinensis]|uniref:C-type cytochrome n=1 Tax=Roseobacter sinensis TaxID=2931391 RepID=A0ABT3BEG1_9RHOB|nr:cytochrome c [Roseobacter sp. WL0113]MCV3271940.1 c-type cytochrome [Roseobacter sp. WL0113]
MRFLVVAALCFAQPLAAQDVAEGERLYRLHCAACHGAEADGGGPMAPVLLIQPADLTTLSERNDGTFPVFRVVKRIDGRDPLVSHGSDMPVYGWFFEGTGVAIASQSGQPIMTSQPVADLVTWLKTVQD